MNLKNKIAVVTGGSDGIGKEIVLALSKNNVKIAIIAQDIKKLQEIKKIALEFGAPKVEIYSCDLKDNIFLIKTCKKIIKDFNTVDILLNVAGIWQKLNKLEKITFREIKNVIDTNLTGVINITQKLLPYLKKHDDSAIINISSRSGYLAQDNQSVYTASKFGVRGFTEALKVDLKETNIRVAGVYQGGTDTDMFKKVGDVFDQKHFIKPEDLARVIIFMLSQPKQIWLHDVRVEY